MDHDSLFYIYDGGWYLRCIWMSMVIFHFQIDITHLSLHVDLIYMGVAARLTFKLRDNNFLVRLTVITEGELRWRKSSICTPHLMKMMCKVRDMDFQEVFGGTYICNIPHVHILVFSIFQHGRKRIIELVFVCENSFSNHFFAFSGLHE